jgi:PhnB protein
MTDPTPYLYLPGTARQALTFYGAVFGGTVALHTFAQFGRTDGPAEAVAHGALTDGPVALFAADLPGADPAGSGSAVMLALLGTADPGTLRRWFIDLSHGGRVQQELQTRAWGAVDGLVIDHYGIHWLIGFEGEQAVPVEDLTS